MIRIIVDNKVITPYGWTFAVTVRDEASETHHSVTVAKAYYTRLTGDRITPEQLVQHSFEYLLSHEPKESILAQFPLPTIQKYFPDYETSMRFLVFD